MFRTFAVRVVCPNCDCNRWITLSNREESFDEIRRQNWELKCHEHGPQKAMPVEVLEIAPVEPEVQPKSGLKPRPTSPPSPPRRQRSSPRTAIHVPVTVYGFGSQSGSFHETTETVLVNASGALVLLKARLSVGDSVCLIDKITGSEKQMRVASVEKYTERESRVGLAFFQSLPGFWRRARSKPRVAKSFRVVVKGQDAHGRSFKQSAFTVDVSKDGARLDGVSMMAFPGQTVEVRRLWRKAHYRVVWVGQVGGAQANQVGLYSLNSGKNIWNLKLPDTLDSQLLAGPRKKEARSR